MCRDCSQAVGVRSSSRSSALETRFQDLILSAWPASAHTSAVQLKLSPPRLVPIGSHLGAPAHGSVGTGPCPPHCRVDNDPSRSMLYERTAHPLTLGTRIALA